MLSSFSILDFFSLKRGSNDPFKGLRRHPDAKKSFK